MQDETAPVETTPAQTVPAPVVEAANTITPKKGMRFGTVPGNGTTGNLTDNYLPVFAINPVMQIVFGTGNGTDPGNSTIPIQGIQKYTFPQRGFMVANNTLLTGAHAGKQLVTATSEKATSMKGEFIFGAAHYNNVTAVAGQNYGNASLQLVEGSTAASVGAVTELGMSQQGENDTLVCPFEISINAGWSFSPGNMTGTKNPNA